MKHLLYYVIKEQLKRDEILCNLINDAMLKNVSMFPVISVWKGPKKGTVLIPAISFANVGSIFVIRGHLQILITANTTF